MSDKKTKETLNKMTSSWVLIKRLYKNYVIRHWKKLIISLLLMLVAAVMTGAMAKLMEPIIDKVFAAKDADMLWPVALTILGVFFIRGITTYSYSIIMSGLGQRVISDINEDMFKHLIYADLVYFHDNPSGHLVSRFLSDTLLLRRAVIESLMGAGRNFFTVLALLGVMFYQDWKLSIISIFVFPLAAFGVAILGKKLRRVSEYAQEENGDLSSRLGQAFQGIKHIRSYRMEKYETKRIANIIENIYRLMYKSFKVSAITSPMAEMLSGLAIVTIVVYGGYQVIDGVSTAGKLFSFITAFLLAFEPMKRLSKLNSVMQTGLAAADRLFTMLDNLPLITDKENAIELELKKPVLSFEGVSFVYKDGTRALNNVSFEAPEGKTIALVGESGSGKSTSLNLIPRFYDVTEGSIKIDGQDIRDLTLSSLRKNMALVSQEIAIFNDSIKDNIAYGSLGATEEEIIEAAKLAAAHEFILELPKGYDTIVGEQGVKLSGGQRQRISIARAMLKNAPILLLDEATSALDTNSEKLVQNALEKLQKDKTTIVVAHRLSTIINADIIYVLDNGIIAESGKHKDLLAKKGIYSRLYGNLLKDQEAA